MPPRPAVAAPVPSSMAPLLPPFDVPLLKISAPLTPDVPELIDRIVIAPLDVDVPSPDAIATPPPVCAVLRPADACTLPPVPDVPLPAVISTMPPRPAVAAPVPSSMAPLLPDTALPLLKISMPLTPDVPELIDRIVIAPLDVDVPSPDARCTPPPVCTALRPVVATPVPSISAPLLPSTDVPEPNTSAPLTPDVPELALRIDTTPLDVDVP